MGLFGNHRRHERHAASGTATVYQGRHKLELQILDISLSGIRLQVADSTTLTVGGVCFITLPEHGKHDAQIVDVKSQSFGFQFLTPESEEVRSFIDTQKQRLAVRRRCPPTSLRWRPARARPASAKGFDDS